MTSTYTEVFGGTNIYPSDVSYLAFSLTTSDITLAWPVETNAPNTAADYPTARIMDVNCTGSSRKVYMPAADQASVGECALFNNIGSTSFTVVKSTGVIICTVAPGTLWQVYMTSNTTAAGVWMSYQFGSTTSSANAALLAGAGLKAITTTLNQAINVTTLNSAYTLAGPDRATLINWTGASATLSLTAAVTLGEDWFCYVRNSGSSNITIDPNSSELINGEATITVAPENSFMLICDGTGFYTVGLSQASASGSFDYLAINVSGTGNYTLSTFELNRISYNLTGALTGNRNIIVPATVQQYWITNATTGAFTLTVKTSAGTGIAVAQGDAQILYCNGTNVVLGQSGSGISIPVPVADGGTGATTASGARINLGGTSTGIAVFTAADAAAARAAISAISTAEATAISIQYAVALG
jgi:hypothetical protein